MTNNHLNNKQSLLWCITIHHLHTFFKTTFFWNYSMQGFWGYVSTCFAHLEMEIFTYSYLQNNSNSVRLFGDHLWKAISIGILSLALCFEIDHSIVALAVCLGSMSCWNMNLCPRLKSFSNCNTFSLRVAFNLAPSTHSSSHHFWPAYLSLLKKSILHSMMLSPACFTVGDDMLRERCMQCKVSIIYILLL